MQNNNLHQVSTISIFADQVQRWGWMIILCAREKIGWNIRLWHISMLFHIQYLNANKPPIRLRPKYSICIRINVRAEFTTSNDTDWGFYEPTFWNPERSSNDAPSSKLHANHSWWTTEQNVQIMFGLKKEYAIVFSISRSENSLVLKFNDK